MPTAQLVYDDRQQPSHAIEYLQVKTSEAYAAIQQQVETALRIELAKLAPQDRRLFRAELAEIQSGVDHDTIAGTWTMWLQCDPPKTWVVERGSDDDNMTDEQAAQLVKAGTGSCRFDGTDSEPCATDVCDACHPEAWV